MESVKEYSFDFYLNKISNSIFNTIVLNEKYEIIYEDKDIYFFYKDNYSPAIAMGRKQVEMMYQCLDVKTVHIQTFTVDDRGYPEPYRIKVK